MGIRTLGQSLQPALYLYHTDTVLGWRVLRRIRHRQGEKKVADGVMRRVNDQLGNHIGYQMLATAASHGDKDLPSQPSSASISPHEMDVNALRVFSDGKSRTYYMSEEKRLEQRIPEDSIERIQRKIEVYSLVGAAKGDILRAWPR